MRIRIRIQQLKLMGIHADPDPQPYPPSTKIISQLFPVKLSTTTTFALVFQFIHLPKIRSPVKGFYSGYLRKRPRSMLKKSFPFSCSREFSSTNLNKKETKIQYRTNNNPTISRM
jgi:hypothetical protein